MYLARRAYTILREEGVDELAHRTLRFYRRRFPGLLTPMYPRLIAYENEDIAELADEVYTTQEPQTADIDYAGELRERAPEFVDNRDWMTENLGRKVYQFSDAEVIGSAGGLLNANEYRPPQEGPPSTIRVGGRFVVPKAIGTRNPRRDMSFEHVDRYLGTAGLLRSLVPGRRPDREFELAFLLTTPYGQAYGGFQSDLMKLRAYERYRELSGRDPQLIVPPDPTELVRTYLSLMGYPPGTYVTLGDETIGVGSLLVPSQRPRKGSGEMQPSPSDRPWMRDRILSNLDPSGDASAERLYVSRQDERRRRVVNIEEIRPILEAYGFREYNPGNHPLEDQIRTFSRANLIVGPHGSGMLNSMFATDATVIELLSTDHWRSSTVFLVAEEMGFEYEISPCRAIDDSHPVTRHRDVVVDRDRFEETIERAVRSPESPPSV